MVWTLHDGISAPAPGRQNEDAFGVAGQYAWVIDGSTPLGAQRGSQEESAARVFARSVSYELANLTRSGPSSDDLRSLLVAACGETPPLTKSLLPTSAAAGLVKLHGNMISYALLADIYLVVGAPVNLVVSDDRMKPINTEADMAIASAMRRGLSFVDARESIEDLLISQRTTRMNQEGSDGYRVLTADPESGMHAVCGSVNRPRGSSVLLCSDGFARLGVESAAYTWPALIQAAREQGCATLVDELRRLEELDPADNGFVRLSRHDDATALLLD